MSTTHFMLMYDSCSGIEIKNRFATLGVNDVQVGNFDMLLNLACEYRLIPKNENNSWEYKVSKEIKKQQNSFWKKSLEVDESSVVSEVTKTLKILLNSLSLDKVELPVLDKNENRYTQYYNDIKNLHDCIDNIFPPLLAKARVLKRHIDLEPIKKIVVYTHELIHLNKWEKELLTLLGVQDINKEYKKVYEDSFIPSITTTKDDIKTLQTNIFNQNIEANKDDINLENIQFLVSRDLLQSIEVTASMVQNIVEKGEEFGDIIIIAPNGGFDKDFLIDTFDKFNIPMSKASKKETYEDLANSWLKNAIYAQGELSSPMLFASLLSSPLMPYSLDIGQYFAQKALSNSLKDIKLDKYDDKTKLIISTVSRWQENNSMDDMFIKTLFDIQETISSNEKILVHKQKFKTHIEKISEFLSENENYSLKILASQISYKKIEQKTEDKPYLNSVSIINEDELLLHKTKHLFVLGFNDGHYLQTLPKQGVFSHIQWNSLSKDLNLPLELQKYDYELNKELFKKQVQSASHSITFLSSSLDFAGDRLSLSNSMSDIVYIFKSNDEDELDIEKHLIYLEKEDQVPFFFSTTQSKETKPYHTPKTEDLNLGIDLFSLRKNDDGTNKPESPSSLEKLMISPLAWLLYRQGIESKVWGIEELDVATQGTIAHGVYEDCFNEKYPLGDITNLDKKIQHRIKIEAPFLAKPHLTLAKEQLINEIKISITKFKKLIDNTKMIAIKAEDQLNGEFAGISVAGRVDVIVELDGKKMIIDYKKSKSSKRVKRMEEGYDHQLLLYKVMLDDADASTAYFTLNDTTLVVDKELSHSSTSDYSIVGIEDECSINAKKTMEKNIKDIQQGIVKLNYSNDDEIWDKRGVTASYTLDSLLVSIFTKDEEGEGL